MTKLSLQTYTSKELLYKELDKVLFHNERANATLAMFKTKEFIDNDLAKSTLSEATSLRYSAIQCPDESIPTPPGLVYGSGSCLISENSKEIGLAKHIHAPRSNLPTITVAKKIYNGKDECLLNLYKKSGLVSIKMDHDFVICFDSSRVFHEVIVPDSDQSVWQFIVMEYCQPYDLEAVKEFYNCKEMYNLL